MHESVWSYVSGQVKSLIYYLLIFSGSVIFFLHSPSVVSAESTIKIMTFNGLGGDNTQLCASTRNHEAEMQQITNFIRNNTIKIAHLQEMKKIEDGNCDFDLPQLLQDQFNNTSYTVYSRQYISVDGGNQKWFRMFIYTGAPVFPIATAPVDAVNGKGGAEAIVLDTAVGRIRFINVHPPVGQGALHFDQELIPFVNQFKSDGIPIIIMGDFNLRYDLADAGPVLARIESGSSYVDGKGFYRACDPAKFPNGNCNDTIKGPNSWAIDHVLIDKRATFVVKNAYVEQSMQFSEHLPVVVELSTQPPPTPTPINFIPNCYNLTGPTSIRVGSSGSYTATVYSPQGQLTGSIFHDNLININQQGFPGVSTATIQGTWTPTAADIGSHFVHCRAWNDSVAECRPPNLVDRPPRYACVGPNYTIAVQVLPPNTPTPTSTSTPTRTPTRTPTPTPTPNPLPIGIVDTPNRCTPLSGWTCDPSNFQQALSISYFTGSTLLGSLTASSNRTTIASSCGGTIAHGFQIQIPVFLKNIKNAQVKIQATDIPNGTVVQLPGSPATFTCYTVDENNDGILDLNEWREMFREFYKTNPNTTFQANTDSLINAVDFGIVRRGL